MSEKTTKSESFIDVTNKNQKDKGEKQWIRRIDDKSWIVVHYKLSGLGYMECTTTIIFTFEPGDHPEKSGRHDGVYLMISGDWRDELESMPKDKLRDWYSQKIYENSNSTETVIEELKQS